MLITILVSVFFAVLFLQSGLDKVFNWKDNLSWLREYFGKTPLKNSVLLMLGIITVLEVLAGTLSGIGSVFIMISENNIVSYWGIALSSISLLCLFFGQRIAKDYPAAASLVPYFILSLLGLYFVS